MIKLEDLINSVKNEFGIKDKKYMFNVTQLLVANQWYGYEPTITDGVVFITEDFASKFEPYLRDFSAFYNAPVEAKTKELLRRLADFAPQTAELINDYKIEHKVDEQDLYHVLDFLLGNLPGELTLANDKEVETLVASAAESLQKKHGDLLCDFLTWSADRRPGARTVVYEMTKRYSNPKATESYEPTEYLRMVYHLFNSDYISTHDMYACAAASKDYTDTWLYLSLHFVCAWRDSDLERLPHPHLPYEPVKVLQKVKNNAFPADEARQVLYSIYAYLNGYMIRPNKTSRYDNIPSLHLFIPSSIEVHFGILLACAESHYRLNGCQEQSLIRRIYTYQDIRRNMGEDIGSLFLSRNFSARSANKSYMQIIESMTRNVLGNDDFAIKGYMLASIARSHKGDFSGFANITSVYLRNSKESGYKADLVALELMERGVLSFLPNMLLSMISKDYPSLPIETQTEIIKELDLTPSEVEGISTLAANAIKQSSKTACELYSAAHNSDEILAILHKIGNGEAVSRTPGSLCLKTATNEICPYPTRSNCIGCAFEIGTKTTLHLMKTESKRIAEIIKTTSNPYLSAKYHFILTTNVIPAIAEMIACLKVNYGDEANDLIKALLEDLYE